MVSVGYGSLSPDRRANLTPAHVFRNLVSPVIIKVFIQDQGLFGKIDLGVKHSSKLSKYSIMLGLLMICTRLFCTYNANCNIHPISDKQSIQRFQDSSQFLLQYFYIKSVFYM